MKGKRKLLQPMLYVLLLLAGIIILFRWYTTQNSIRIAEKA